MKLRFRDQKMEELHEEYMQLMADFGRIGSEEDATKTIDRQGELLEAMKVRSEELVNQAKQTTDTAVVLKSYAAIQTMKSCYVALERLVATLQTVKEMMEKEGSSPSTRKAASNEFISQVLGWAKERPKA